MHTPPPGQGLEAGGRAGRGDLHSHTAAPMHIPGSELRALLRNDLRFNSSPFQHSHQQVTSWWISVGGSPRQRGEQTARGSRCLRKLLNFYQSPSVMTLNVDITETHLVPNIGLLIAELNQNRGPKKLGDKSQHKQPIYFLFFWGDGKKIPWLMNFRDGYKFKPHMEGTHFNEKILSCHTLLHLINP